MDNNIDTITLAMSFRRCKDKSIWTKNRNADLDWRYIGRINYKITSKLYLPNKDRKIRNRAVKYRGLSCNVSRPLFNLFHKEEKDKKYYWQGNYQGYQFKYNEKWQALLIMLPHDKIENYTAEQILEKTRNVIMKYFELQPDDLNELTLNRIDIYCDYRYKDKEELEIIKNVLDKAPDWLRNYKKDIEDTTKCYLLKYLSQNKAKPDIDDTDIEEVVE